MLNVIILILIILTVSGQNIVKKPYTNKVGGKGAYFFTMLVSLGSMLFFIRTSKGLRFDPAFLPYSIGFGVCYALCSVCLVLAIACGPLSLTSLFSSFSLMIPTFYGLLFLKDPVGKWFYLGLVLLCASLFLTNKKQETESMRFSFKWLIYVLLVVAGNGMCTVVQKMEQMTFDGGYKNEFMIVALGFVTAVMLVMTLLTERKELKVYAKAGWHWGLFCGLMNGLANMLVMVLTNRMAASLMYPMISAGGLVVTYLVARFIYRESLSKTQFAGFVIGLAAVVFLSL